MKHQPTKAQKGNDVVMTPEYIAKTLVDYFNPTGIVLEPCKGTGNILKYLPENSPWCELSEGKDFFDYNEKVDWIFSNPPWSKIRLFLIHSMTLADDICFLFTLNHLCTSAKIRDIKSAGFGIKELVLIDQPKEFPRIGFQLAMVHIQKGYTGPIHHTYLNIEKESF